MSKLIALVGHKGAGKTSMTATAIYDPRHTSMALPILHMSFSKPIMDMLEALGIPAEILHNKKRWNEPLEMLCGKTTRHAAQTLGTEWGRNRIDPYLWTRIALVQATNIRKQGTNVIIDNVRFPTEFDALRAAGATMVAFIRPGLKVDTSHESEAHIEALQARCDMEFWNDEVFATGVIKWRNLLTKLIR